MRTTIDLPDDLYHRVKARAALDGLTPKELIARYVERGLRDQHIDNGAGAAPARVRSPLPVIIPPTGRTVPALSSADLARIEDEEDLEKHERSLGR